ncbi:hypothetical protein RDV64_13785 [Acuticoccus sp. MNP-M23]|uniref:hypothetical protein n=1 Tax=Acuticoccus sp. MNP-M23 TaxID=3072793 RepID=UPI002816532D|nr:hypothetical protein [Acuticoccus sp. MNP-M23]WMS41152.1 hypothetical protein RDV64_13785 [Acuticoccus sp. MNP-M23]
MAKRILQAATAVALSLLTGEAALAQARVGVTAAVNPQSDFDRSGGVRTVVIGDEVLFKDRIVTGDDGLVQVLFVDGSNFTVGPGARVVIDEFVYNPSTGSGSLVAEVTSGALRFVGGKLSKRDNQVRFRTPGGTLGVRGGITNVDLSPGCLPDGSCPTATASLVFGDALVLALPGGGTRRVDTPGYSFAIFGTGARARADIVPTARLDLSSLQQRLAGKPDRSGGSRNIPTDANVTQSGVSALNSARAPFTVLPRPRPVVATSRYAPNATSPGIATTTNLIDVTVMQPADSDAVTDDVVTNRPPRPQPPKPRPPEPPLPPEPAAVDRRVAAFATPPRFDTADGQIIREPGAVGIVTALDLAPYGAALIENDRGRVVALQIGADTLPFPAATGETRINRFRSQTLGRQVEGTVYRGADNFALYTLQQAGGPAKAKQVAYFLTGETTRPEVMLSGDGAPLTVRRYSLTDDYQKRARGIRSELHLLNPLIAREFGASLADAAETRFHIVQNSVDPTVAGTLYGGLLIDGTGPNQRSAINVDTGFVATNPDGGVVVVGQRRGSTRTQALLAASTLSGATGSRPTGARSGGTVFGADGDNFVYTSGASVRPLSEGRSRLFVDNQRTGKPLLPSERRSMTTQVATLEETIAAGALSRSTRSITGFAAGMIEPNGRDAIAFRSTDAGDVRIDFNAPGSTLGGVFGIEDIDDQDPVVRSFRLAFGTDIFGGASSRARSTYVDDDMFAGVATGPVNEPGSPQTTLTTDDGATITHSRSTPGTYMISADAVPQPALFENAGVTPCDCRFMEWGWWGTSTEFEGEGLPPGRNDVAHLGTWVAGDITPDAELPTTGTGSYAGHAVGTVVANQPGAGKARYVAAGQLRVNYDFGSRSGDLAITKFDGRSFGGRISGGVGRNGVRNRFGGNLTGKGLTGSVDGAFARGPKGSAQGVLGAFNVRGSGYRATGNFLGERR